MDQDGLTTMSVAKYQGVINYPPGIITCQMDASGNRFPPRWVPGVCGSSHAVCNECGTWDYEPYYSQGFQWMSNNCHECLDTYNTTGILPVHPVESGHYTIVYWVSNEVCVHCTWQKGEEEKDRKKEEQRQKARETRRRRMDHPEAKDARNAYDRSVYDFDKHSARRRKYYADKKRSKEDCEKEFHAQRQRAREKQFEKVAVTAKAKSSVPKNPTSTAAKKPLLSSSKHTAPAKTQAEVKPANKKPLSSISKQSTPAKTQVKVKPAKNALGGIFQKKKK